MSVNVCVRVYACVCVSVSECECHVVCRTHSVFGTQPTLNNWDPSG